MTDEQNRKWTEMLSKLSNVIGVTSDGQVALLRPVRNAEDFVVTLLVGQLVAHRAGQTPKETLSVDEILSSGGLAYRPARKTIYNTISALAQSKIIQKDGNKFRVGEQVVLQFLASRLERLQNEVIAKAKGA